MTGLIDDAFFPLHRKTSQPDTFGHDDYDKLVCYRTSAENALDLLVEGSASINNMLAKAITNRDNPATQEEVLNTLSILNNLSQLMQNLLVVRNDANYILDKSCKQSASADVVEFKELRSASA